MKILEIQIIMINNENHRNPRDNNINHKIFRNQIENLTIMKII